MIHDRVDVERWKAVFPVAELRDAIRVLALQQPQPARDYLWTHPEEDPAYLHFLFSSAVGITGPRELAILEQKREEKRALAPAYPALPADVFVFSKGGPENRAVTKVGGLPYWPAGRPWPHSTAGEPLTFLVQFCFADSLDITGPLPGDLLLLFASWEHLVHHDPAGVILEWISLGETQLVSQSAIPTTPWNVEPCFGSIYRSYEYPYVYDDEGNPEWFGLGRLTATKIGGSPIWRQDDQERGNLLCASNTISPIRGLPYPFLNVEEPIRRWDEDFLKWGDSGNFNIFLNDGRFDWGWDCC